MSFLPIFCCIRISRYLSELRTISCVFCEGSWRTPPLRRDMATLPCCLQESHWDCFNSAVMAGAECPSCGFPLNIEGVFALQRAKGKAVCTGCHHTNGHAPTRLHVLSVTASNTNLLVRCYVFQHTPGVCVCGGGGGGGGGGWLAVLQCSTSWKIGLGALLTLHLCSIAFGSCLVKVLALVVIPRIPSLLCLL